MYKIENFEKGEAKQRGRWIPVTTFLVVTNDGTEWCCLNGHHGPKSEKVKEMATFTKELLEREARERNNPCDGRHGIYCTGCWP